MAAVIAFFAGFLAFVIFFANIWCMLSLWSWKLYAKCQQTGGLKSIVLLVLAVVCECVKYFEIGGVLLVLLVGVYAMIFG